MKKILIIGATSAIATAWARLLAEQQAEFFLVARNAEKLTLTKDDLMARGATAVHSYVLDIDHFEDHQSMIDACFKTLKQVDVALIAHGTLPHQQNCQQDVKLSLQEFSNNGLSVISLLTLLANAMELQRSGTIAVISSVAGDRGRPSNYLYGSAKAAVSAFCEGLRARLFKSGVHVLTIKPGFVDTPMTKGLNLPGLLLATPQRVGKAIEKGINSKKDTLYAPGYWKYILFVVKSMPGFIFKRAPL